MRLLNYRYENLIMLNEYIETNKLQNQKSIFIQIYGSNQKSQNLHEIRDHIRQILPQAELIGTTTAGIITDGRLIDDVIMLSFSVFEYETTIKTLALSNNDTNEYITKLSSYINSSTKLLILFTNTFTFEPSAVLRELEIHFPNIVVAGGKAADDFHFEKCEVFSKTDDNCDALVAVISSEHLNVTANCFMNWDSIGKVMTVTKSKGSEVYEIDNQKAIDIYRNYLGDEIANRILEIGSEFPLIYKSDDVDVARALIAANKETGSITFAGEIPQGTKVRFGFANIEHLKYHNQKILMENFAHTKEAIYVYSCAMRRNMLGSFFENELAHINAVAPTSGFITYGEFFHKQKSCSNILLNITTTFVVLSENESSKIVDFSPSKTKLSKRDLILEGLTTLVSKSGKELDETLYYLEQFEHIVNEASIISKTNSNGIITYVNKNLEDISGYTNQELIGQHHNIVRHPDMPQDIFKDMWSTIKKGEIWNGLIKNRRKDGVPYYLISEVSAIYNKDGTLKEYISVRTDVTELEEYKSVLTKELSNTNQNFKENIHYIQQYETAVNSMVAIIKINTQNKIIYANEQFYRLSGYTEEELIGVDCSTLRVHDHHGKEACIDIIKRLKKGEIVRQRLHTLAKNDEVFVTETLFCPITDVNGKISGYIQVMHDITPIVKLNNEIIETQKDIVQTMGMIGETRSKETGLHVVRVAEYSRMLAKLYGLDEQESELLWQASPMHDIGKVGIEDAILNKPGKLSTQEYEIMKTHSQIGYDMLKKYDRDILKAAAIVAYTHHEKWDGTGYPNGLKGEDIHIFGRITAVADVFDALGHDRVYKKAWADEQIFDFFKEERGKHFDPKLVDLFFQHIDMFKEIRNTLKDNF
ncbi:MAG: PAS domain S-box protein [Sulfurospirillaceae bacterium]|nr:PAS domain S-box protein [Sulfurospirillaceae bacterium]